MIRSLLTGAILVFGFLYIFFIPADPVLYKIFMKLIPMALIILLAFQTNNIFSRTYKKLILFGLFICMIADAAIYWFLAGLITFFVGHIFYIFAFRHMSRKPMPKWVGALLLLYGGIMAVWLVGTQFQADNMILGLAILAYITIILLMGWQAIRTRMPLAIIGALLFIFSDSVLAIDRFIEPIPYRDAFVMITYYAAQFFIAKSIGSKIVKLSVNRKNLIR